MSTATRCARYGVAAIAAAWTLAAPTLALAQKKPNILVVFGEDIGQTDVSAYCRPRSCSITGRAR